MDRSESKPKSVENRALGEIAELFDAAGWRIDHEPFAGEGLRADLLATRAGPTYAVEIKALSEGRPDRVIALLSQAILQARTIAREISAAQPLALVWVSQASPALLKKVDDFHRQFASDVSIGVVSGNGLRHFVGAGLAGLNADPAPRHKNSLGHVPPISNLFSDLNQWMLKVLLAPEISERLLNAPRGTYRNVSELAGAAGVSVMSAFRFVTRLRQEGFLDESGHFLRLVRRAELFRRWQVATAQPTPEARMRFLIPGAGQVQLRKS